MPEWMLVPLITAVAFVAPQIIGLLIVAVAPSRGHWVCQVLRAGSKTASLAAALEHRQLEQRSRDVCACEHKSPTEAGS